jgi:hypothetical protein
MAIVCLPVITLQKHRERAGETHREREGIAVGAAEEGLKVCGGNGLHALGGGDVDGKGECAVEAALLHAVTMFQNCN